MALRYNPSKTTMVTKEKAREDKKWFMFDAKGKRLGHLASEIAKVLRGKHQTTFTPHNDCGDGVIVINVEQIEVSGAKDAQKIYRYYTGNVGGLREIPYRVMKERKPDYILRHAVKGMLQKNKLGDAQMKKLRIFAGEEHDMQAQQPILVNL